MLSNLCAVSARDSKKSTMIYRDLVSITVSMPLLPWVDGGLNGPHMSLPNAAPTRYLCAFGWYGTGCCLAAAQLEPVIHSGLCLNVNGS